MDKDIEELLPFYALDALTDEERELVEKYLAEHPEARRQIEEMSDTVSALPLSVSPVEPPRRAKKAVMARVVKDAEARARSSKQSQSSRREMRGRDILRTFTLGI